MKYVVTSAEKKACDYGTTGQTGIPSMVLMERAALAVAEVIIKRYPDRNRILIVAGKGNIVWGILLLLIYSVGHGILAVVAGTSIGFVQKLSSNEKYGRFSVALKVVMGTVILFIGFYMFYLGF